jgi:hypothetical protein
VLSSVALLTLGAIFTIYIGEKISKLKLGNGTSLLIFTSILSYLPSSFGRTVAQGLEDGNYIGLAAVIISFFLLVLGIVYVQASFCIVTLLSLWFEVTSCSTMSNKMLACRKLRENFQSTMPRGILLEVEGFRNLPIYLSRLVAK